MSYFLDCSQFIKYKQICSTCIGLMKLVLTTLETGGDLEPDPPALRHDPHFDRPRSVYVSDMRPFPPTSRPSFNIPMSPSSVSILSLLAATSTHLDLDLPYVVKNKLLSSRIDRLEVYGDYCTISTIGSPFTPISRDRDMNGPSLGSQVHKALRPVK